MNCWSVLGIEAGSDKKTIKLAYARLLKKTRPDDDPDGFTILHAAYKQALAVGKTVPVRDVLQTPAPQKHELKDPPSTENSQKKTGHLLKPPEQPSDSQEIPEVQVIVQLEKPNDTPMQDSTGFTDAATEESADFTDQIGRDWKAIRQRVETLTTNKKDNTVAQWSFLDTIPSMFDLRFRSEVSAYLFDVVSKANLEALQKNQLQVKPLELQYLCDYFQWESNWKDHEATFGKDQTNAIYSYLNDPKNRLVVKKKTTHYFSRMFAFAIDIIFVFVFLEIQSKFIFLSYLYLGYIYLLIGIPIMEASHLQASIGKLMIKLIVVDKHGLRLSWGHSLIRHWVTLILLFSTWIGFFLNLYTEIRYKTFVHDAFTKTYVIDRYSD